MDRAVELLNPMRDKNDCKNRGGEGTTPVTTACFVQKLESKCVCEEQNKKIKTAHSREHQNKTKNLTHAFSFGTQTGGGDYQKLATNKGVR